MVIVRFTHLRIEEPRERHCLSVISGTDLVFAFLTIAVTIFIVELTDKDAILLLTLATRIKALTAFAAGATAFTITSAIIVSIGYFVTRVIPLFWVRLVGGFVMIGFATWQFFHVDGGENESGLFGKTFGRSGLSVFLGIVSLLVVLDLSGDATEILTIVYVAHFGNVLLVFVGAVVALVAASALETVLGQKLSKILTAKRIRIFSLLVFLIVGSVIVSTTMSH